jgi:two-component system chemotaxis response regulator CheB
MGAWRKIRVLIVDDSIVVRRILTGALSTQPDIEVVGAAADPYAARDLIDKVQPDVLTLDIEMPRMDGLTFLRKLMAYHPMPVLVISSLAQASCAAALQALAEGAVEALPKPAGPYSVGDLRLVLADKVRAAAAARVGRTRAAAPGPCVQTAGSAAARWRGSTLVAIGASTGGTEAIARILERLPADFPAIVMTQHMPAGFTRAFAERLNRASAMEVKEAEDGDEVRKGRALLAPGGLHMVLRRSAAMFRVAVVDGPHVCYQKPSVDVLFSSVAAEAGRSALGVILTGMGGDGASGLLKMHQAGARTIAQDEETCVVFGMPREAIRMGGVDHIVPLNHIAGTLSRLLEQPGTSGSTSTVREAAEAK